MVEPTDNQRTKMPVKPLVSVVLIFLNEEKFIEEAIASVIAQTYDNWELLLVDDGSTDSSSSIAQKYSAQYSSVVKYLQHPNHQNRGMSASRNLGIEQAEGEYIAFIDGDDVWLPQKLAQQVAIMQAQPDAALVCGRTKWWYGWTGKPEDKQRDFIQTLDLPLDALIEPPQLLLLFLTNEWASLHDILVRQKAIATVGGYNDSFPGMYEDQVFHAKLCLNFSAYIADQCWCLYRQHPQACTFQTHDTDRGYFTARKTFLIWLKSYLQIQFENTEVLPVVDRELWHYLHPQQSRILAKIHRLKDMSKNFVERIK